MQGSTKDLRLEMRVKNNILYRAVMKKYSSLAEFCRNCDGVSYQTLHRLLSFREHPCKHDPEASAPGTDFKESCLRIEATLGVPAEELFPRGLYDRMMGVDTFQVKEASSIDSLPYDQKQEILALPAPERESPESQAEMALLRDSIGDVISELPIRLQRVVEMRFGLNGGSSMTLDECGSRLGVSGCRVAQLEAKAIRMMNLRGAVLKQFLDGATE